MGKPRARPRRSPCTCFMKFNKCTYGSTCKFSHDRSEFSDTELTATIQSKDRLRKLRQFTNAGSTFNSLRNVLQFVEVCSSLYEASQHESLLTELGNHVDCVENLLRFYHLTEPSLGFLQNAIIPFFRIVCSSKIRNSAQSVHVNTLYRVVYNNLLHLYQQVGLLYMDMMPQEEQHTLYEMLYEILLRFNEATHQPEYKALVKQMSQRLDQNSHAKTRRVLKRVLGMVGDADEREEAFERLKITQESKDREEKRIRVYDTIDPPGDLSPQGPRHTNDHANIQQIRVCPTTEEILSTRPEHLPLSTMVWSSYIPHKRGMEALFDRQFRLLRFDMVGGMRSALQLLLKLDELPNTDVFKFVLRNHRFDSARASKKLIQEKQSCTHVGDDDVGLRVFRGFDQGYTPSPVVTRNQGLMFEVFFRMDETQRNMDRFFKYGGLVCLVFGSRRIVFGTIQHRIDSETLRSQDEPELFQFKSHVFGTTIELANSAMDLPFMISAATDRSLVCSYVVLVSGVLYSTYECVLGAMQRICPVSFPFSEIFTSNSDQLEQITPPEYAQADGFRFELRPILSQQRSFPLDPMAELPTDLAEQCKLDEGQCQALLKALCSEIALIKGPPGTGKSTLGVAIAQVLLETPGIQLPIICVCYTNHALDQFLLHLLENGVEDSDVVRIGRRTDNARIKRLELNAQTVYMDGPLRSEIYRLRLELDVKREKLQKVQKAISIDSPSLLSSGIEAYMRTEFQWYHDQLFTIENVTAKRWMKCQDIDEMKRLVDPNKKPIVSNRYAALAMDEDTDEDFEMKAVKAKLDRILNQNRSLDELLELRLDPFELSPTERQTLVQCWSREYCTNVLEPMAIDLHGEIKYLQETITAIQDAHKRSILKRMKVVGVTTSGAARQMKLMRSIGAHVVICEEAGEVLESHILSCLNSETQHLILIGDHLQLRPQINTYGLSMESKAGLKYSLDESLFERLVREQPHLFPTSELSIQRRMRPEIADSVRTLLYPDLQDGEGVRAYPHVVGLKDNVYFLDHQEVEAIDETTRKNEYEVNMVTELICHLTKNGYATGDIAVLTPYLGQLRRLRDVLSRAFTVLIEERDELAMLDCFEEEEMKPAPIVVAERKALGDLVRISTIDNYQGEESKIIIVSLVRNELKDPEQSKKKSSIGFLRSSNRTNVLLSRAQHGMFLLGNANLLEEKSPQVWKPMIAQWRARNQLGNKGFPLQCSQHPEIIQYAKCPMDFKSFSPDGGCSLPCESRLQLCGHQCPLRCHTTDPGHKTIICSKPCLRLHKECNHICPKRCGDPCGQCQEPLDALELVCGHEYPNPKCYETLDPVSISCKEIVIKQCTLCEHQCRIACSSSTENFKCKEDCGQPLPCGHSSCKAKCFQCQNVNGTKERTRHVPCRQLCGRQLSCGHACPLPCHSGSNCKPCAKNCWEACKHSKCAAKCIEPCSVCAEACAYQCSHDTKPRCALLCGAPCNCLPCEESCDKILKCGHYCVGLCGEVCPPCIHCASSKDKDMVVDLIMQSQLRDVDPEETRLVVLPNCGHVFTVETMDGWMEMDSYFTKSSEGKYNGIVPIDVMGEFKAIKLCPNCRYPITGIFRYGRVVNRAKIDASSKKFISQSTQQLASLTDRLNKLQQNSDGIVLKDATDLKRQCLRLLEDMEDSQPTVTMYMKAKAFVLTQNATEKSIGIEIPTPDANLVLSSCLLVAHATQIVSRQKAKEIGTCEDVGEKKRKIQKYLKEQRQSIKFMVERVIETVGEHRNERLSQEAKLLCLSVVIDCISQADQPVAFPIALYGGWKLSLTWKREKALEFVEQRIREIKPLNENIVAKRETMLEKLRRIVCYQEVSVSEKISIVSALNLSTGHFYRCPNGHSYVIGECGMAMETSLCPECGAAVGGGTHQLLETNTRDTEMEGFLGRR